MPFLIGIALAGMAIELVVYKFSLGWKLRRSAAYIAIVVLVFCGTALLVARPNLFSLLFFVVSLYRIFNLERVLAGRMHEEYLRHASGRTSLWLINFQLVDLLLWLGWLNLPNDTLARHDALISLVVAQTLIAASLLVSVVHNIVKTRPRGLKLLNDSQLPTLTVCVPARNETDDLQQCLETLLASDYPKLEILVLDDCSQLKRTPEIIRQFAHDGVEFIQGIPPPETWLAKNWAYKQLFDKANGDYVLFCGVDIRLAPNSLRLLVSELLLKHQAMISVMPERLDAHHLAIIQPMRYWWELVPPRQQFRRPPVLSSCWVANRRDLKEIGGFEANTRTIVPEAYFARTFETKDTYSFMRSSNILGVSSVKRFQEQRETSLRTRYPQLHRRPELVLLLSLLELSFLVLPFIMAVAGWWTSSLVVPLMSVAVSILLVISYEVLIVAAMPRNALVALLSFPFTVGVDMYLLNLSMYKYEFSEVDWKGRNVCIPAMHFTVSQGLERST